jgi:precorrin-2 dehydrogenase/sirohydrochlorin ferrochelatase
MHLYSLCLKLQGARCVVIGGGNVARRKAASLLECGAQVTVISPELCRELEDRVESGEIKAVRREFEPEDLRGARLAIAATNNRAVNETVSEAARRMGVLLNVVDVPELCDFYVPASVRRGRLEIAVSTTGAFPALAKKLRIELESRFGREYGPYLELLEQLREEIKARVSDAAERNRAEEALLEAPVLEALAQGKLEKARGLLREAASPWLGNRASGGDEG